MLSQQIKYTIGIKDMKNVKPLKSYSFDYKKGY